ncbi:MAG: DegT/DnrJ/EryC1/StrS family aminotransferase [Nitrososphaeria archaeon]
MIPINKPIIEKEEKEAVQKVLDSRYLTDSSLEGGKFVREFEQLFAERVRAKYAVAVNSGTSALLAALLALGTKEGDETITSGFTFSSTATTSIFVGAKVKFADIDIRTYCISIEDLERKISEKTKTIIPVHLYGHPSQMDRIMELAKRNGLDVVEDAAQALGSEYKGKAAGSIGKIGCFSLYATKVITCGEGGMLTTNDGELAHRLRMIRSHGQAKGYDAEILGLNLRMPQIEAAIGIEQIKKLDKFIRQRTENARYYNEELSRLDKVVTPTEMSYAKTNWSIYTVFVKEKRDEIVAHLRKNGVSASVYYPIPLNRLPLFKKQDSVPLPNCEKAADHVLSLPVHPALTEEDKRKVCDTFKQAIRKFL